MEGLCGTAIRLAVRDPSCPQGPGPARNSKAPVGVRGLILQVAAATITLPGAAQQELAPARRVVGKVVPAGGAAGRIQLYSTGFVLGSPDGSRPPATKLPDAAGLKAAIAMAVRVQA
jgi:hypothetical protein